jgi:uncharacterized metal-binding protein YceD (DUF177 family)
MERIMPQRRHLRLADLSERRPTAFLIEADAGERARLAAELGLSALRKLRLEGELRPRGKRDWDLAGRLGATVVQPCVVTLEPVTTRIEEAVARSFVADHPAPPPGAEVEMPEDDTVEPLPDTLDLGRVMAEALTLAIPLYPRSDGAGFDAAVFTEPGQTAMSDEAAKPFAGLARLRDRLDDDS